jgi:bifunctional non-homologous end joining protein LigD
VLPVAPRTLLRYQDYLNILPQHKDKYISKPKTPSSSSQNSPTNSRLSPNPKSVGGVNLTPLISALLLAGIKLALEQKKIAKKAKASKATKTAKASKATKTAKASKATKTAKASKATKTAKTSKATKATRRRKTI